MAVKSKKTKKTKTKSKSCPTCGSVECFERPRFFGGQLLTDKDLDAAQRYVIEKNRLHNRYLVGTGVVCGLIVRCHPSCNGFIIVDSGYAIDCCGNDIVLCDSVEFDIIQYLADCFQPEKPVCDDIIRTRYTNCDEGPKEYCLVLSYNEEHTHPVTAFIRDNGCTNSRCEPSRTSEIFQLDLIEKQDLAKTTVLNYLDKLTKCTESANKLIGVVAQFQKSSSDRQLFYQAKNAIWEFYKQELDTRCNLAEELQKIETEFLSSPSNTQENSSTSTRLLNLAKQLKLDCECNTLLVPCAECDPEQGVLLACLTIENGKILKICNNVRQQLITGPMLRYFLPPSNALPQQVLSVIFGVFNSSFAQRCCEQSADRLVVGDRIAETQSNWQENRTFALFNLMRDFPNAPSVAFNALNLSQVANTDTLTALDLYSRNLDEVRSLLESQDINIVENTANTRQAAYSAENLAAMAWTIPSGSRVELIISPDTKQIASIHLLQGGGQ
jgi:hypothetical protein